MRIFIFGPPEDKSNAYLRFIKAALNQVATESGLLWIEGALPEKGSESVVYFRTIDVTPVNAWWLYNLTLPWLAKKMKADKIISLTGTTLSSSLPQDIILSWVNQKLPFHWQRLARKKLGRSMARSKGAYSCRPTDPSGPGKIRQLKSFPLKTTAPVSEEARIQLKNQHADSQEFFYATLQKANEADFVFLLKAFSNFKKWQLSNMRLLIEGSATDFPADKLANYRYRGDIRFVLPGQAEIRGAAYGAIHITRDETDVMPALECFQIGVPAIISSGVLLEKESAEAALIFDPGSFETLARQLIDIYKNEQARREQINRGRQMILTSHLSSAKDELRQLLR